MNKHEKIAKAYEDKNFPKEPNTENLKMLTELSKKLKQAGDLYSKIETEIQNLKLPTLITQFVRSHPTLEVTGTTDKMCSVFCVADKIDKMPHGATDIEVKDNKIKFRVLID